ncbi:HNH endonuclease signature motif containing protein [uncultured Xylophilus sp.]|uniref:HNH endonuclease n=1 Tax=uncultured Xylophilus sp. TaxID=296832 RepID=UPI0025E64CFA|nr:HNH endonuclease signature motif containing protein [uncultured Xylophilus sp.]
MSSLRTLNTRLSPIDPTRLATLQQKAGTTDRPSGRRWAVTRERIALAHGYRCVDCGLVWTPSRDHIDHDVPLEQGGSNDDANLKPRCLECHAVKTAEEAGRRAGGVGRNSPGL